MSNHKFKIGQVVSYNPRSGPGAGVYRIAKLVPASSAVGIFSCRRSLRMRDIDLQYPTMVTTPVPEIHGCCEQQERHAVAGVVIAGGCGFRIGGEKALLSFCGGVLLDALGSELTGEPAVDGFAPGVVSCD